MATRPCCLDAGFGRPLQAQLKQEATSAVCGDRIVDSRASKGTGRVKTANI